MDLQELQSHKKRTQKKIPQQSITTTKHRHQVDIFSINMVIRAAWQTVVMLPVFLAFFFVASRCLRRFERRSRGWHLPYKKVIDARTIAVEMRCTICRIFQSPSSRLYRALEFVLHLAESQQPAVGWRTASNTGFHKQICQSYPQASSPGNGRRSTC